MNTKILSKIENQLMYLKARQESLEELIFDVKESSKERDFVECLSELITGLENGEVLIYGKDWNTIEDVECREAVADVICNHIRILELMFDLNYKIGDGKK